MDIPNTHIDLIERYLANKMSEEERKSFQLRLEQEPELADQLKAYQEAREAIDLFAEERLKANFRTRYYAEKEAGLPDTEITASDAVVKPLGQRRRLLFVYAAAAAVLLIVAVFIGDRFLNPRLSSTQLYAQYYEMPALNIRGDGDRLESVQTLMDQGQYQLATDSLQLLLADITFQRQAAAWLRLGLCYMELEQWIIAADAFAQIEPESPLVHQARWYGALTALQRGQLDESRQLLRQVLKESRDTDLKADARVLLDELE